MSHNITTGFLVAALALVVLAGGLTGMAAAQEMDPTTTTGSDWQDDNSTVVDEPITNDSIQNATVEFETNYTSTHVSMEISPVDRDYVVHELDSLDDDGQYTLVQDGDSTQNNIHEFTVEYDQLDELPTRIDSQMDFEVTLIDEDGGTNTTFTVQRNTSDERAVFLVDDTAVENDSVGMEVEEQEPDNSTFAFWEDNEDDPSTYHLDASDVDTTENTTVHLFYGDSDVASDFSDVVSDEASNEDVLEEQTVVFDGSDARAVYYESAGDAHEENASYAVYSDSDDRTTIELGEDRTGTLDIHVGNHGPDHDALDVEDLSPAYAESIGFWRTAINFGVMEAWSLTDGGWLPLGVLSGPGLALAGFAVVRRRQTA